MEAVGVVVAGVAVVEGAVVESVVLEKVVVGTDSTGAAKERVPNSASLAALAA